MEEKYLQLLKDRCNSFDTEKNHLNANDILCDLLEELGYMDLVKEFRKIKKWYS